MKRTFTYLLLLVLLVCGKQAYNLLISNESIRSNPTGALSEFSSNHMRRCQKKQANSILIRSCI